MATAYEKGPKYISAPYDDTNEHFQKIVQHQSEALPHLVADIITGGDEGDDETIRWQTQAIRAIAGKELAPYPREEIAVSWAVSKMLESEVSLENWQE